MNKFKSLLFVCLAMVALAACEPDPDGPDNHSTTRRVASTTSYMHYCQETITAEGDTVGKMDVTTNPVTYSEYLWENDRIKTSFYYGNSGALLNQYDFFYDKKGRFETIKVMWGAMNSYYEYWFTYPSNRKCEVQVIRDGVKSSRMTIDFDAHNQPIKVREEYTDSTGTEILFYSTEELEWKDGDLLKSTYTDYSRDGVVDETYEMVYKYDNHLNQENGCNWFYLDHYTACKHSMTEMVKTSSDLRETQRMVYTYIDDVCTEQKTYFDDHFYDYSGDGSELHDYGEVYYTFHY